MNDTEYEKAWSEEDKPAEKSGAQKLVSAVDKMSDAIAMSSGAKAAKPAAATVAKPAKPAAPATSTGDPVADAAAAKDAKTAADIDAGVEKVSGAMASSGGEPKRRTESEDYMMAYEDLERKDAAVAKA